MLMSTAWADGLVDNPAGRAIRAGEMVIITDLQGVVTRTNRAFAKALADGDVKRIAANTLALEKALSPRAASSWKATLLTS